MADDSKKFISVGRFSIRWAHFVEFLTPGLLNFCCPKELSFKNTAFAAKLQVRICVFWGGLC
jgi:hypothetical protein